MSLAAAMRMQPASRTHRPGLFQGPLLAAWVVLAAVVPAVGEPPDRSAVLVVQRPRCPGGQCNAPYIQDTGRPPNTAWDSHARSGRKHTAQQPHPAVARIIVPERGATSYGSGTLVDVRDELGLVITNWHVVRDASGPVEVVFPNGFRTLARPLKVDKDWDLAALVIWRPEVAPVALADAAPRPGDVLTIAGYGSGQYRAATGRCTQYVAPGMNFPFEMVEVNVQARQGDSGGPIFNHRGELAGVLFGAGQGTTSGSYAGRVQGFLTSVAPDLGRPRTETESMLAAAPDVVPLKASQREALRAARQAAEPSPPESIAATNPRQNTPLQDEFTTEAAAADPLLAASSRYASETSRYDVSPKDSPTAAAELRSKQDSVATLAEQPAPEDSPRPLWSQANATPDTVVAADPVAPTKKAPTAALAAPAGDQASQPTSSLSWRDVAGDTLFDQVKAVLAGVGLLATLWFFVRLA